MSSHHVDRNDRDQEDSLDNDDQYSSNDNDIKHSSDADRSDNDTHDDNDGNDDQDTGDWGMNNSNGQDVQYTALDDQKMNDLSNNSNNQYTPDWSNTAPMTQDSVDWNDHGQKDSLGNDDHIKYPSDADRTDNDTHDSNDDQDTGDWDMNNSSEQESGQKDDIQSSDDSHTPDVFPNTDPLPVGMSGELPPGAQNLGAPGQYHTEEVENDQDDGYEYHHTSDSNHELHGNNAANSVLVGSSSSDALYGGTANDVIDGADGDDLLDGGEGNDIVMGGGHREQGHNRFHGGTGDDILVAGGSKTHHLDDFFTINTAIRDTVAGDAKYASLADLIAAPVDDNSNQVSNVFEIGSGEGHDQIFNFHAMTDKLLIQRELNGSGIHNLETLVQHMTVDGNRVSIDFGNDNSVTLVGVDVANLSAANVDWA